MVVANRFRLKKLFLIVICLICFLLFISLALLLKSTEVDVLPFGDNELDSTNANNFLHFQDAFEQPVPNVNNLRYHQNSAKSCTHKSPALLIIVHSAPAHILHRKAIRQTWASSAEGINYRTIFVIGRSAQPQIWHRATREALEHGDVVLVDMPDTYSNMTLKHLVGIHWVLKNCPKATYVLKADDDAFIDIRRLMNAVNSTLSPKAIACRVVPAGTAPRRSGKWQVTRNDYPFDDYPEYCSGLAYFSRIPALASMYEAAVSGRVPYLWIDDVFMTGFSATYAGLKRVDLSVWFARTEEQVVHWLQNETGSKPLPWMVSELSPRHWPSEAVAIWNKTRKAERNAKL